MDSTFEGVALDPTKCSKLSMDEKRELVYELSKRTSRASEMLQSWSRQEILQVLCAEMGKERKYTGLTKLKIIENLLKIVADKNSGDHEGVTDPESHSYPTGGQRTAKRQRKADCPSRLTIPVNDPVIGNGDNDTINAVYCKNSACKATLRQDDIFCKRCSCCICYKFDDNKDPSLWLSCNSEPPFQGNSCGMSCHLECALKHEKSGIGQDKRHAVLDGSFYCVACGKVNDLLGCWRKQMVFAKDTRRVDILCYRVSLGQKLLNRTEKYHNLSEIVDEAVKKLEAEVGPLTGVPVKIGRGIVNRLSSGPEVQKLCSSAVESMDQMLFGTVSHSSPNHSIPGSFSVSPAMVRFVDVHPTSVTVIVGSEEPLQSSIISYTLWHRKACDRDYPVKSTCILSVPNTRFVVTGLTPATEYLFKVVSSNGTREFGPWEVPISTGCSGNEVPSCLMMERSQSPATNCSSLSNPSSVEDETNNITPYSDQNDDRAGNYGIYSKDTDNIVSTNLLNGAINCTVICEDGIPAEVVPVPILGEECPMEIVGPMLDADTLNLEKRHTSEDRITGVTSTDNDSDAPVEAGTEQLPFVGCSVAGLPITPCRMEITKNGPGRSGRSKSSSKGVENGTGITEPQDGRTSKKKTGERQDEECMENGLSDTDFEHYVKVIRWLECKGHIEKNFRQKFLTWYSLRATPQEVRIVKVFVDIFITDPASLAEQLVDTFSDCISSKGASVVPAGFCMKLWH